MDDLSGQVEALRESIADLNESIRILIAVMAHRMEIDAPKAIVLKMADDSAIN